MEYFAAVARSGSFRRAAEQLGISQPTITAQVARMEQYLGITLFERGRNGATLTPAGRQLLPQARTVLDDIDAFVASAGEAAGGAAIYRLGVKSTLGPYLLPRILPSVHAVHEHLKLYVREESPIELEGKLENGELDLILTAFPTNSAELAGELLLREDIRLAVPADHPLARQTAVQASDLRGTKILTIGEGHQLTRQIEQVATRLGAQVLRDYEGTSLDALRLMVVMGMGLAFLPALYSHSEIRADSGIVIRDIEDETIARMVGLAWRPTSPARAFYRRLARDMRAVIRRELGGVVKVLKPRG
jgi:LysR family hydrogen peroxide-inducible transcriptional activator